MDDKKLDKSGGEDKTGNFANAVAHGAEIAKRVAVADHRQLDANLRTVARFDHG